jgi:hypothetical protein
MTVAEPIDPTRVKTRLTDVDRAADSDAAPLATALGLFSVSGWPNSPPRTRSRRGPACPTAG